MTKAFVFGKFMPFHKGHEAMIKFALTKCDFLTVLICSSDKEQLPDHVREGWLQSIFSEITKIEIRILNYKEDEYPNTSVSSSEVSKIWSKKFKELFPDYSLLITSEPYGDLIAEYMAIVHIPFDIERKTIPVSSSKIRTDIIANWSFLPDDVKKHYIRKIVILGSESTGKTTLTIRLAKYFNASFVPETARDLIKNSNFFSLEDLYKVAVEHSKRIEKGIMGNSPLLIIDTDIHITQSYAYHIFKKELDLEANIYELNKADLYLYLNNDVTFIQDGTRLNEAERNKLDSSHRALLNRYKIPYYEIKGDWENRFEKSVSLIENLLHLNE
jgi:HTH-type transcriptional repressor of NAD biosynthesis genes